MPNRDEQSYLSIRRPSVNRIKLFTFALILSLLFSLENPAHADGSVLVNGDFESGSLDDWIFTGDVMLATEMLDPYTIDALHTVAEGTYSARLGDDVPWGSGGPQASSLSQEVIVPPVSEGQREVVLQFAYAVVGNDPPEHAEPDKPLFRVTVFDVTANQSLYDTNTVYTSQSSQNWYLGLNPNSDPSQQTFSFFSGDRWVFQPWQDVQLSLEGREGHTIRLEFTVRDCNPSAHAVYGYLDSISVGDPVPVVLPPLEGNPQLAPYIAPNPLNILFGYIERWQIWPWCLCLFPVALLLAFALRRVGKRDTYITPSPPPERRASPKTKREPPVRGGLRPEDDKSQKLGKGGFRPPSE